MKIHFKTLSTIMLGLEIQQILALLLIHNPTVVISTECPLPVLKKGNKNIFIYINYFFIQFPCLFFSLLELFATSGAINETYIENLTQEDIIRNLNSGNKSGVFLIEKDFNRFLGGIERNSTGHIIGAKATYINWFSEANLTAATLEKKSDPSRQGMGLDENVKTTTPLCHSGPKLIILFRNCFIKTKI